MSIVLTTERLILRMPTMGDLPGCVAFFSSERSHMMGGPWTPEVTARNLQEVIDLWASSGFGLFIVTVKGSDCAVGLIGPWQPDGYPEAELGWSLWDKALEGKGIAFEAACAARDWFFATTGRTTALSYTDVNNQRSHLLCERMGAVWDPDAPSPSPPPERIYRHFAKAVTGPWDAPMSDEERALAQRFAALVPVIRTKRTVLRAPRLDDFGAWFGIMGSDRALHIGISDAAQAWMDFGSNIANWVLRGHGLWTVTNHSDVVLGFVMVDFEPGDAEHELGYFVCADAEGQGFVTEAAAAARDYAVNDLRLPSLVSYIAPGNLRSAAVAARLGATRDRVLDGCDVWRHHPRKGA